MVRRAQVMQFDPIATAVFSQPLHLHAGQLVLDRLILVHSGHIMIRGSQGALGMLYPDSPFFQIKKCHRRGDFVDEVFVDKKHVGTCRHRFDYVCIPDFIK